MIMSKYTALEEYFQKEYNTLIKKVARRAGSPENAEDVVQEAFFRACKYWSSYNPETKLGAWFNTILNNACKDKMREDRMMGMTVDIDDENLEPVVVEEIDHGAIAHIKKLIHGKNESQKEILRLYYEKGYKPTEIKEILDAEYGTIRQTIWRFKEEVKEKLGE